VLRTDQAAVFMCGLPYSRAEPQPVLIAASDSLSCGFHGTPHYWSDFVVRKDSALRTVQDAFGQRIAFTVPGSQSGCAAALTYLMALHRKTQAPLPAPLFSEITLRPLPPWVPWPRWVDGTAELRPIDSYALRLAPKISTGFGIRGASGR